MSSAPSFTSREVFTAAEMDVNGFYVIVEGDHDVPIFSELLLLYKSFGRLQRRPIIGSGGGKPNILHWLERKQNVNVHVVLDRDFDDVATELSDGRIVSLESYSIENCYFDKAVISPLLAHLTATSVEEVDVWLDTDALFEHWSQALESTISILYYYQKAYGGEKNGWGVRDLIDNRDRWTVSSDKVSRFNNHLLQQMEVTIEECTEFYIANFPYEECFSKSFPGKVLQKSLFRYLKDKCIEQGGDFSSLTNAGQLMQSLTPRLMLNPQMISVIDRLVA
jgi:hypothetical protein